MHVPSPSLRRPGFSPLPPQLRARKPDEALVGRQDCSRPASSPQDRGRDGPGSYVRSQASHLGEGCCGEGRNDRACQLEGNFANKGTCEASECFDPRSALALFSLEQQLLFVNHLLVIGRFCLSRSWSLSRHVEGGARRTRSPGFRWCCFFPLRRSTRFLLLPLSSQRLFPSGYSPKPQDHHQF